MQYDIINIVIIWLKFILLEGRGVTMSKGTNQKLKILYLMRILLEKTDEENTITLNEIITELGRYGISAERKSIYDDIEALRHYSIDIATRKKKLLIILWLIDFLRYQN